MSVLVSSDLTGAEQITLERQRQIDEECRTSEHDDTHTDCELALAAVSYAAPEPVFLRHKNEMNYVSFIDPWPWGENEDNRIAANNGLPLDLRIKDLIKAGALCAAEIDRLARIQKKG